MPNNSTSRAKARFAILPESVVLDSTLCPMDLRILALALCRTAGKGTSNAIPRFNASDIARDLGKSDRHAIIQSLRQMQRLGILVAKTGKPGTKTVYDLHFDNYLARVTQGEVQTCVDAPQDLCESEHPLNPSNSNIKDQDNETGSPSEARSHVNPHVMIAGAPTDSLTCVKGTQVGSGISPGWANDSWARETLNGHGGPYWLGDEWQYHSMIALGGLQAFIDAVFLLDVRRKRGMMLKKNAEDFVADAIKRRYDLNGADRAFLAKTERDKRIIEQAEDIVAMASFGSIEDADEDIRDEVAREIERMKVQRNEDEDEIVF